MAQDLPFSLVPLASLPEPSEASWGLLDLSGRVVEVSGPARLTAAFALVLDAQRRGEAVAWVALQGSTFYPPDAAESGVDLRAVAVVRVSDFLGALVAADEALRSGAFGLVVVDAHPLKPELPPATLSRLSGLAYRHDVALVFLTEKGEEEPSLGSLVSLRAVARRVGLSGLQVKVLKDKRRGPGRTHEEPCHGPPGLR